MYPALSTMIPTASQAAALAWDLALDIAAATATDRYPSDAKRISGAVKLIHKGMIAMQVDGTALVESRSTRQTYHVNGTCQCEAIFRASDRGDLDYRCAHRWAKELYNKALCVLTKLHSATYQDTHGFAYALPEDSGYSFFESWKGGFSVLPGNPATLILHGKCAWIEDGRLVGMVPQAALDMQQKERTL